jgi:hypothetical protein
MLDLVNVLGAEVPFAVQVWAAAENQALERVRRK